MLLEFTHHASLLTLPGLESALLHLEFVCSPAMGVMKEYRRPSFVAMQLGEASR